MACLYTKRLTNHLRQFLRPSWHCGTPTWLRLPHPLYRVQRLRKEPSMTERELKPCPFCGNVGLDFSEGSTFRWMIADCQHCGGSAGETRMGDSWEESEERAIAAWNRRASLPEAPAEPVAWQPIATARCWCRTCRPITLEDCRFVVCPDCGNKRCPKANDHRHSCTNSNDPGQPGSAYPVQHQEGG